MSKKIQPLARHIVEYIVNEIIVRLFPNTTWTFENEQANQVQVVAQIYNQPSKKGILCKGGGRVTLKRAQVFTKIESIIIEKIFEVASDYQDLDSDKQMYLIANTTSQIIAKTLVEISSVKEVSVIAKTINILEHWANETYEGKNISVAIAINPKFMRDNSDNSQISFDEFIKEDFAKVLSNAYDTLVEFSADHFFLGHHVTEQNNLALPVPFRYISYATYTNENEGLIFVLNRNAELLIFYGGKLLFAKRRGDWRYFSDHITQQIRFKTRLRTEYSIALYEALFESLLDTSFARTGACIGVIDQKNLPNLQESQIIDDKDYIYEQKYIKSSVLFKIIKDKKFFQLDRRTRQEILAIDGSLVLGKDGEIIAIGAILRITITQSSGDKNSGGARLAAAKALSQYGTSFKVSSDGEITAFHGQDSFRFG